MERRFVSVVIAGAGIVGLATGWHLAQSGREVRILEKEPTVAAHQSGRNSGVIHAGIYYRPGSLKARYCREGRGMLEDFCREQGVPFERCGKVIIATDESEVPRLHELQKRADANGIANRLLRREELVEIEPHARGVAALHSPETGIVDYKAVCHQLRAGIEMRGGQVQTGEPVTGVHEDGPHLRVTTPRGEYRAQCFINCAGLQSDRVARLTGAEPDVQIVPFRGEYYQLRPAAEHLCRTLIYPVPDPSFPFLGVHFTRICGGGVECGPNAVLAFAREGYRKTDVNLADIAEMLGSRGLRRIVAKHWRTGLGEYWRSFSKGAFVRALQRLVPEIAPADLTPIEPGIRAQAVTAAGDLCDDFLIQRPHPHIINVLNAPSPAATAALRIGAHLSGLLSL